MQYLLNQEEYEDYKSKNDERNTDKYLPLLQPDNVRIGQSMGAFDDDSIISISIKASRIDPKLRAHYEDLSRRM